jgi:hypothetical protein
LFCVKSTPADYIVNRMYEFRRAALVKPFIKAGVVFSCTRLYGVGSFLSFALQSWIRLLAFMCSLDQCYALKLSCVMQYQRMVKVVNAVQC